MENENIEEEYNLLTEMQKRFIDYYIETANATEACKMAGYKGKNLNRIGSQNLSKLDKFIKIKLQEKENQRIASQDEVLQYLTKVMRGEEKDQFGLDASLQDRTKCAELLGRRYGTFKEKVEVAGNIPVVITDDITE
jgi:phage terminase small subunit